MVESKNDHANKLAKCGLKEWILLVWQDILLIIQRITQALSKNYWSPGTDHCCFNREVALVHALHLVICAHIRQTYYYYLNENNRYYCLKHLYKLLMLFKCNFAWGLYASLTQISAIRIAGNFKETHNRRFPSLVKVAAMTSGFFF